VAIVYDCVLQLRGASGALSSSRFTCCWRDCYQRLMNKAVFSQARTRLAASAKKANSLKFARSLDEIKELWSEYLTEHQRAFTRLGNAMDTGQERSWFDRVVRERRDDELLKYLEAARHADEHGRAEIAQTVPGGTRIGVGGGTVYIERLEIRDGKIKELRGWQDTPGKSLQVAFDPARIDLSSVENRGVIYPVPSNHLGKSLDSLRPARAAELSFEFLEKKMADCEQKFS
jgi:hypothetical protein